MSVVEQERTSALESQARVAGDQVRAAKERNKELTRAVKALEKQALADADEIVKVDGLKAEVKSLTSALKGSRKESEDLAKELVTQKQFADAGRAVATAMKVLGA